MSYFITLIEFFIGIIVAILIFNVVRTLRIPARIRKAELLFEEDNAGPAMDIVQNVLERKRGYIPALYLKSKIFRRQRQYILAIAEANNVLKSGDYKKYVSELDVHYLLADLYSRQQLFHKEIEEYKLIITLSPTDVMANHQLGLHYYKQKKYREARDMLIRAIAGDEKINDAYLALGVSCFHLSEYAKAEEFLLRAIEVQPIPPAEAYYHLGIIYRWKKDNDGAVKMFGLAKRDPDYSLIATLRIGEIYFEKEEYPQAIEVLESGISWLKTRDDDSIAYRYLLAECYEMGNLIKEAVHHWEKIEAEHPNYKNTQMKIADYKAIMGDEVMKGIFTSSLDSLQPLIAEIIARLNFNIIMKKTLNPNQLVYKAYNIKRINDPPLLIFFDRTTREVNENAVERFSELIKLEKCKTGIYIATSRFSMKAKGKATSEMMELLDKDFVASTLAKIKQKQK
jgi:tetratricopeptide (TPR) repeat protein